MQAKDVVLKGFLCLSVSTCRHCLWGKCFCRTAWKRVFSTRSNIQGSPHHMEVCHMGLHTTQALAEWRMFLIISTLFTEHLPCFTSKLASHPHLLSRSESVLRRSHASCARPAAFSTFIVVCGNAAKRVSSFRESRAAILLQFDLCLRCLGSRIQL